MTASSKTEQVMTVLGPVAPSAIGTTMMHEHLAHGAAHHGPLPPESELRDAKVTVENAAAVDADPMSCVDNRLLGEDAEDLVLEDLADYRRLGGRTVVELTPLDLGPNPQMLRRLSETSGIHVVAATGHYLARHHSFELIDEAADSIAGRLERHLTEGMAGTDIRAGMLKAGASNPLHPSERKVLEAVGQVQAKTGAPVTVHLETRGARESNGHEVLDVLEAAGADLGKTVLAHLDMLVVNGPQAVAHQRTLAERGCSIGFDTCVHASAPNCGTLEQRADSIAQLFEAGVGDRVTVSSDLAMKVKFRRFGGVGLGNILRNLCPRLLEAGLSADDICLLLDRTPRRLLSF